MSENENIKELVEKTYLSKEMVDELGLTEKEAREYENAMALVETIESISADEIGDVMDQFYKIIPDDYEEGLKMFMQLVEKQPEFIKKVLTAYEIINEIDVLPEPKVEKVSLKEIKDDNLTEKMKPIYDFIYGRNNK